MSGVVHSPAFGLTLTLVAYLGAGALHRRMGRPALLTPVLVAVVVVASVLQLVGVPYDEYLRSVSVLTLLLGPATVALALPLLDAGRALLHSSAVVLATLLVAGLVSVGVTVLVLETAGTADDVVRAALPRSVTTPVALTVAETISASAPLVVVMTLVSGITGAVAGPALLTLARVRDERARGFAVGVTSHGIGTARALTESPATGAWSSAGMVLNALAMTLALPFVARAFGS
ncbi:LrgB family protein [Kineococcus sp. NUM-3379]